MPSDDIILNVRQIAGYPPSGPAQPGDSIVLQRGGLGGPYLSNDAATFVGTACAEAGPLMVGTGEAPADAVPAQIFTDNLVVAPGATHNWNCYFSSLTDDFVAVASGPVAAFGYNGNAGFVWDAGPYVNAGAQVALTELMQLSTIGQLVLTQGSLNVRDPIAGNEVATAQWVAANTVASFNGRTGPVTLGTWDILFAGGAPLWSPQFGGIPLAPTPEPAACGNQIATAQFVKTAIVDYVDNYFGAAEFVSSFNGRTGPVVLEAADVTALTLPYAPIDSPNFEGYATSITPPPGTSTGQIATTAFVMNAVADSVTGVATWNTRSGNVVMAATDITAAGGALLASPIFTGTPAGPTAVPGTATNQLATTMFVSQAVGTGFAPLDSPAFTGVPTAPTAAVGTDTSQLATCQFVMAAVPALDAGVLSFNGRIGDVTLLANDISAAGGATLVSPAFTGNPTAPTRLPGDSSAALATTGFVTAAINALPVVPLPATTTPLMNGPPSVGSLATFSRGDHVHPSDTTRLALTGGALTGPLAGTSYTFSGAGNVGSFSVVNGVMQITKGTSANPVIFFNDGSTNRLSFYFNVSTGGSTWTDNFSGANIVMGPTNAISLNAAAVNSAPLSVNGALSVTTSVNVNGCVLNNTGGYLTSVQGFSAPILRWTSGANGLLNQGGIPLTGDIAQMAIIGDGSSPTGLAFSCTNTANTVAYWIWVSAGSDIRMKRNIEPTAFDALAAICAIPVRQFDFDPKASDTLRGAGPGTKRIRSYRVPLGLVAQEVMGIIPEMDIVVPQPEGHDPAIPTDLHAIALPNAIPYLIRAIQQLEMRVRDLEGRTLQ
jgi:Chaperone of endosialidase